MHGSGLGIVNGARFLRLAAVTAILGAATHLTASTLEPDWLADDPGEAARAVAESGFFIGDRVLDLASVFLIVGALSVVARTLSAGPGREWARLGQPFLVLMGALWAGVALTSGALKENADTWTAAAPGEKQAYLAAFDTTVGVADALSFGWFFAWGVYLGTLGASILADGVYARWIGWAAVCGGALKLVGILLVLVWDAAYLAVLAGSLVFMAVLVGLGVSLWRNASGALFDQITPHEGLGRSLRHGAGGT
jgi:hypothetical protein